MTLLDDQIAQERIRRRGLTHQPGAGLVQCFQHEIDLFRLDDQRWHDLDSARTVVGEYGQNTVLGKPDRHHRSEALVRQLEADHQPALPPAGDERPKSSPTLPSGVCETDYNR